MNIFLIILIITQFFSTLLTYTSAKKSSINLQNYCVSHIQSKFEKHDELSTIVCGVNKFDSESIRKIKNIGLIHVFVMSASQISFWLTLLQKMKLNFMTKFLLVNFINLISGFQAPVVRYIIHFFLHECRNEYKIQKGHLQILICFVVGFFIVRPFDFFSLQLSCLFSLLLCLFEKYDLKKLIFIQFIFFFYSNFIFQQDMSLISIPLNLFFVPFLSFILYPASILIFILSYSFLHSIANITFNYMWQQVDVIINWSSSINKINLDSSFSKNIDSFNPSKNKICLSYDLNKLNFPSEKNNLVFSNLNLSENLNLTTEYLCSSRIRNYLEYLSNIDLPKDPSSRCLILFFFTYVIIHFLNYYRVRRDIKNQF